MNDETGAGSVTHLTPKEHAAVIRDATEDAKRAGYPGGRGEEPVKPYRDLEINPLTPEEEQAEAERLVAFNAKQTEVLALMDEITTATGEAEGPMNTIHESMREVANWIGEKDIVERLREDCSQICKCYRCEAADEIELLRAHAVERVAEMGELATRLRAAPAEREPVGEVTLGTGRYAVIWTYGENGVQLVFRDTGRKNEVGARISEEDGGADPGSDHEARPGDIKIRMGTPESYAVVRESLEAAGERQGWATATPEGETR